MAHGDAELELTARGRASRDRLVRAAAALMLEHGVAATSLDAVLVEAHASKSQLYHYFRSKRELVDAVIDAAEHAVIDAQEPYLSQLDSVATIEAWCDHIVRLNENRGCGKGCPLGMLASELAATDDEARVLLCAAFGRWEGLLHDGLARMAAAGTLRPGADVDALATATMASLQGGLLLAKTTRSTRPLRIALDAAIAHLTTQTQPPVPRRRGQPQPTQETVPRRPS